MSSSEARKNMARAGTMQVTSKEGMTYLQKHLPTHYRHLAQLKVHFAEENETKVAKKRPSTAKKNKASPPAKKPKLTKTRTMADTAKEGAMLLGNEVLGDTREMTKKKVKAAKKKVGKTAVGKATVGKKQTKRTKAAKVVANAKKVKPNKSKAAKKTKKPSLKKANTMVKTAKEGKAFIGKDGAKLSSRRRCQKS